MAVVKVVASGLPDLTSARPKRADVRRSHGRVRTSCMDVPVANGDSATSTFEVARIPSHAVIRKSTVVHTTGITGLTNVDLGVAGAPACIAAAMNLVAAGTVAASGAIGVGNVGKALWELAGLPADPGTEMPVFMTINTPATAAGTVAVDLGYVCD